MQVLHVNGERLWQSLMDLARIGATPKGGVKRLTLTDLDRQGRDRFVAWSIVVQTNKSSAMKKSILNTAVAAVAVIALVYSVASDLTHTPQQVVHAQASRVITMETTVVVAKRLPADVMLAAYVAK